MSAKILFSLDGRVQNASVWTTFDRLVEGHNKENETIIWKTRIGLRSYWEILMTRTW